MTFAIVKLYLLNILIAIDQLGNTLIGGDPDETISSQAAKRTAEWEWNLLGRCLEWIDPGHLKQAREDDEGSNSIRSLWRKQ